MPGTYVTNTWWINESENTSAVYLDNQFMDSAFYGIYCRARSTPSIAGLALVKAL